MKLNTNYQPSFSKKSSISVSNMFSGLVLSDEPYNLPYGSAQSAKNVWFENNMVKKRFGQRRVSKDIKNVSSIYENPYFDKIIYQSGTSLFSYDPESGENMLIYPKNGAVSLSGGNAHYLEFGDYLYYKNGYEFLKIDSELNVTPVSGFVPTTYINCNPSTGQGDKLQSPNALGGRCIIKYSSDSLAQTFTLPIKNFDRNTVIVRLSGEVQTISNVVSIDGTVTLSSAVTAGDNELEIEVTKKNAQAEKKILSAPIMTAFGGENEVSMICAGNSLEKNCYYFSGALDASYWPEDGYNFAGSSDEAITGFGKHYSGLILFKEKSVWDISYKVSDYKISFPARPVNHIMGCDCPKTIAAIDNTLVWTNSKYGVCALFSTALENEKNIRVISKNINGTLKNPGLFLEKDLKSAVCVNFSGRYMLFVNSHAYVLHYEMTPVSLSPEKLSWWYFDNVGIRSYCIFRNLLYFCEPKYGYLCTQTNDFRDFGKGFEAFWQSPPMTMGVSQRLKSFFDIYITQGASSPSYAKLKYITNRIKRTERSDIRGLCFSLSSFSLDSFCLKAFEFANTFHRTINAPDAQYLSIRFENDLPGSDMSIISYELTYTLSNTIL